MKARGKSTSRERAYAKLLEAAFARPGVHEAMVGYRNWSEGDRGLNSYRSATQGEVTVMLGSSSTL